MSLEYVEQSELGATLSSVVVPIAMRCCGNLDVLQELIRPVHGISLALI